ncbi:replication restart helicase PriA [Croceiramulus getboli]|nr:primosomal protein N' [Flavobacteriaceae bacterium YJPT1-3]
MAHFVDVILPIPVAQAFTYSISEAEYDFLKLGMRVAVPFGKSKIYTAMVRRTHTQAPTLYEAKEIEQILDEEPLVHEVQMKHWEWIANYYMCTLGEVMRAALPGAFLLESETIIRKQQELDPAVTDLSEDEWQIYEALQQQSILRIHEIIDLLDKRKVLPAIKSLLHRGVLSMEEEIYEQYKPKLIQYVRLAPAYEAEALMHQALDDLSRAPKQRQILLSLFTLRAQSKKPLPAKKLLNHAEATTTQLNQLVEKGYLELFEIQRDRIQFDGQSDGFSKTLSTAQEAAKSALNEVFQSKDICLLHGVTASGKTEVYVSLIKDLLQTGKQILYLLPEIALTTQLIKRLQQYFGERISVYHSKYNVQERVEVWNNIYQQKAKAQIIVGARSAILLPFSNLGLIVVDEEHEPSYKQFDPAPRYHARDAAVVLGQMHQAQVLMGSATPSLETYYNAKTGKYGLVSLSRRFGDIQMPENQIIDIKEKHRKKRMTGHFSDTLLRAITDTLEAGEQVILFQNRRGFSPILECTTCGHAPQCPNCDVSLTYHKYRDQLRCHYCGYHMAMLEQCMACSSPHLTTKGFGTEQLEGELKALYPEHQVARMDSDTTRGKFGYEKIIDALEQGKTDILVGTQMLAKGLDFRNVSLVGVLHADSLLNIPDFRAHERSFQLIQQVSGRAGRTQKRGLVLIQTYNPHHQIIQQAAMDDYQAMYEEQLEERYTYKYPPHYRLIKISMRHRDYQKLQEASVWMGQALKQVFGEFVLGPETPPVARIRNEYYRTLLIKLSRRQNLKEAKKRIARVKTSFLSVAPYRSVKVVIDVDPY